MTTTKPTLKEITQKVIDGWKNEYPNAKLFKYATEDGKHTAYFKSPDISAMEASSVIANTKPITSNKVLAKACFLGGDEEVFSEPKYLLGLGKKLQELVEISEGELTRL